VEIALDRPTALSSACGELDLDGTSQHDARGLEAAVCHVVWLAHLPTEQLELGGPGFSLHTGDAHLIVDPGQFLAVAGRLHEERDAHRRQAEQPADGAVHQWSPVGPNRLDPLRLA
jgi:hypothetical protein